MKAFKEALREGGRAMGWSLGAREVDRMALHAEELLAWNERFNLTGLTDLRELAEKQFLDVLPVVGVLPRGSRVLDLGSGGGFPGLPLKVLREDLEMVLIDGRRKRASFLQAAIRRLALTGIEARHIRAEDLRRTGRPFHLVVSKAVAEMARLVALSAPLLGQTGILIAMKGPSVDREMAAAEKRIHAEGFTVRRLDYRLPFSGAQRTVVVLQRRGEKSGNQFEAGRAFRV